MKRISIFLLAGFCLTCGDGLTAPASGGTQPTPTPRPGTATPTPTATPTATPTPNAGLTCTLSSMPDCGLSGCCTRGGGNPYVTPIADAQTALERERPDIFNSNGSLKIDEIAYTNLLAAKITAMTGICTRGGGVGSASKDEVGLKRDNGTSINVDVIIGGSETPYIGGVYTCNPASF